MKEGIYFVKDRGAILLIEGTVSGHRLVTGLLQERLFGVSLSICAEATRLSEGVAWLEAYGTADLVLLGDGLEDVDGLDALQCLCERFPSVGVVVLAEETGGVDLVEALQIGALDYVSRSQLSAPGLQKALVHALQLHSLRERLSAQVSFQKVLMRAIPYPVFFKAVNGVYEGCNPRFAELFGVAESELRGRSEEAVWSAEDAVLHRSMGAQLVASGQRQTYEVRGEYAGEPRSLLFCIDRFVRHDSTGLDGVIGVAVDVTDLRRLQEKLVAAKEEAEQANRAKGDFLANMSHEIRTPMNAIIGFSQLIEGTNLTVEQVDYLSTIQASGEVLLGVINEILDFSKIEAGKIELERTGFSLVRSLEESVEMLSLKAKAKGIELTCALEAGLPNTVIGDPTRFRQVVINLLSNAVKFTDQGRVELKVGGARTHDNHWEISFQVSDTGIGISEEDQRRLFSAFTQADMSTTRKYGGTGLGLSISHRLVALMGGELVLQSELGRGAVFSFTLDFKCPGALYGELESCRDAEKSVVLVVDDDVGVRDVLGMYLERWGFESIICESGASALELLQYKRARLAIVEQDLPGMNGVSLIQKMRSELGLERMGIILCGCADVQRIPEGLGSVKVAAHLRKPLHHEILHTAICQALGEPSGRRLPELRDLHLSGVKVLVAEDNKVNQKLVGSIFKRMGIKICLAESGQEVIDLIGERHFDLVFMDVQMPVKDGFEATRWIRSHLEKEKQPRIIALTAAVQKEDRMRCFEAGMDNFVTKPISLKKLKNLIVSELHALEVHEEGLSSA